MLPTDDHPTHYDLAVLGGAVLLGADLVPANIGVSGGRVTTLTQRRISAEHEIDASGLVVLPGLIDQHYHSWWGYGFESHEVSTRAALRGGVTTVLEMPLDTPLSLTVEAIEAKEAAVGGEYHVDHAVIGGYLRERPEEVDALADAGVVALKIFTGLVAPEGMYPGSDGADMLDALRRAAARDLPVIFHCEDAELVDAETTRLREQGAEGSGAWNDARSWFAEVAAVQRVALLAEVTGARVVIAHVPTPRSVEVVMAARDRGADIWIETCPHQICISNDDFGADTRFKWNPPTRSRADVEALWGHLAAGRIQTIGSDHAPLPKLPGATIWEQNPGAGNVLQTMFPVVAGEALARGVPLPQIVRMLSETPARLFGLYPRKGTISIGADADLVIVALDRRSVIREEALEFFDPAQRWSPYAGRETGVEVVSTILRGQVAYAEGEVLGRPGDGRRLSRGAAMVSG
jgi:dihydroorotase (multifunctional complex type)